MLTIWKFRLAIQDVQTLELPQGARILSVQSQHELPYLWALVDPDAPMVRRQIHIIGTGNPADAVVSSVFVGTVQMAGGISVGHVFYGGPFS